MKNLLTIAFLLLSTVMLAQESYQLDYNYISKGTHDSKDVETVNAVASIKYDGSIVTVKINEDYFYFTIIVDSFYEGTSEDGSTFVSYKMVNAKTGKVNSGYNSKGVFILEENDSIFIFHN